MPAWAIGALVSSWGVGIYALMSIARNLKRRPSVQGRAVGVCGACGGVLVLYPTEMVAECSCGGTRIPRPFFERAAGQG